MRTSTNNREQDQDGDSIVARNPIRIKVKLTATYMVSNLTDRVSPVFFLKRNAMF